MLAVNFSERLSVAVVIGLCNVNFIVTSNMALTLAVASMMVEPGTSSALTLKSGKVLALKDLPSAMCLVMGFHIVVIPPPFVAAKAGIFSGSDDKPVPSSTFPSAIIPAELVLTTGRYASVMANGLNDVYVLANTAVRVPTHFVGVQGKTKGKDVITNVSWTTIEAEFDDGLK